MQSPTFDDEIAVPCCTDVTACRLHCRSISEKVAAMQKEAARLSPDKAESTNRKTKQTIMKLVDAMKASVDSLSAKQGA